MKRKFISIILITYCLVLMTACGQVTNHESQGDQTETANSKEEAKLYTAAEVLGHNYQLQEDSYEATDTKGGYRHYKCLECQDEYSYETDPMLYEKNPKTGEPVDQSGSSNPLLEDWEHVPDGEPQVFWSKEDKEWRVYLYGSHDESGTGFCGTNYVTWSAPVYDLSDWRYEGVILDIADKSTYGGDQLYAPDCAYDLMTDSYYLISNQVYDWAVLRVSDSPSEEWDETKAVWKSSFKVCYDPSIYIENGTIYVTGACRKTEETITDSSVIEAVTNDGYTTGKGQMGVIYQLKQNTTEGDGIEAVSWMPNDERIYTPIYEGSSLYGYSEELDAYIYLYVTIELGADGTEYNSGIGYLWTDNLMNGTWHYGDNGVDNDILSYSEGIENLTIIGNHGNIISDTSGRYVRDMEANKMIFVDFPTYSHGNNHGSMVKINGQWYFFGHRHTNGNSYSREAIAGRLNIQKNEETNQPVINPMEFTSSGVAESMDAYEIWDARTTCYLLEGIDHPAASMEQNNPHSACAETSPYVVANRDKDAKHSSYVANLKNGSVVGYKYLNFGEKSEAVNLKLLLSQIKINQTGNVSVYLDAPSEIKGGTCIGTVSLSADSIATAEKERESDQEWSWITANMNVPVSGTHAVYLLFESDGDEQICIFDQLGFEVVE